MTRWLNISRFAGALLAAAIMFAVLPGDWIETRLGIAPDGGSGLVELLAGAISLAVGVALLKSGSRAQRIGRARGSRFGVTAWL